MKLWNKITEYENYAGLSMLLLFFANELDRYGSWFSLLLFCFLSSVGRRSAKDTKQDADCQAQAHAILLAVTFDKQSIKKQ